MTRRVQVVACLGSLILFTLWWQALASAGDLDLYRSELDFFLADFSRTTCGLTLIVVEFARCVRASARLVGAPAGPACSRTGRCWVKSHDQDAAIARSRPA